MIIKGIHGLYYLYTNSAFEIVDMIPHIYFSVLRGLPDLAINSRSTL